MATAKCHPDRKVHAKELCRKCYMQGRQSGYNRKWAEQNRVRYMLMRKKADAKRNGVEFNITEHDILPLPVVCPVFGFALDYTFGKGRSFNGPTIDRFDSRKGYVVGNVRVISKKANSLKGDATIGDLQKLLKYMQSRHKIRRRNVETIAHKSSGSQVDASTGWRKQRRF